jgi:hypothetical protein
MNSFLLFIIIFTAFSITVWGVLTVQPPGLIIAMLSVLTCSLVGFIE